MNTSTSTGIGYSNGRPANLITAHPIALICAWLTLVICVTTAGYLSYGWSFTASTFGGVVGFLSTPVLVLLAFVAGCVMTSALFTD